jgi:hypothetical protein
MIAGDLDLDRALADPLYRAAALRFLDGPRGPPADAGADEADPLECRLDRRAGERHAYHSP